MSNAEGTEAVVEVLEDIRRWVKIIGIQEAMPVLQEVLSDEDPKREKALRAVYHLSDGERSNPDIAEDIPYSHEFVRQRRNEWADLGLLEQRDSDANYSHLMSLEEAGIEIPDIPVTEEDEDE